MAPAPLRIRGSLGSLDSLLGEALVAGRAAFRPPPVIIIANPFRFVGIPREPLCALVSLVSLQTGDLDFAGAGHEERDKRLVCSRDGSLVFLRDCWGGGVGVGCDTAGFATSGSAIDENAMLKSAIKVGAGCPVFMSSDSDKGTANSLPIKAALDSEPPPFEPRLMFRGLPAMGQLTTLATFASSGCT